MTARPAYAINYPLQDAAQAKLPRATEMLMLAYSALLTLGLLLSAPWWLFRMATTQRYREGLRQRLGFVPSALRTYVASNRVVWLHAVSVGEVLAASRLIAELEATLGADCRIVISTTTRTGQALAKERFGAERVFYMPLDFAFAVRAYLHALQPTALILMESELWPRLLHECEARNTPAAVVNARISDRSYHRAQRVRAIWSRILRKPTLWLAQSEEDARRLLSLIGDPAPAIPTAPPQPPSRPNPERSRRGSGEIPAFTTASSGKPTLVVTGNLKYDVRPAKNSRVVELVSELAAGRSIIVAGSTLGGSSLNDPNEEEMMMNAWQDLPQREERSVLLVLAPRHPERFSFVHSIVDTFSARASALESLRGPDRFWIDYDVIVLDTIGDLAAIYQLADIAFVGGSLVPRGGHNPLEPAQFGVPVIMGPSFENFRDIVTKMQAADGIRIVQNAEELEATLKHLLTHPEEARALGQRGRAVFKAQQGATARTVSALLTMIPGARP